MVIVITGAAGNLGSLLSRHLLETTPWGLRLLIHKRDLPADLQNPSRASIVRCDLGKPDTLLTALEGVDCIVHFASGFSKHILNASYRQQTRRIFKISSTPPLSRASAV